jgi:hypothetical protein
MPSVPNFSKHGNTGELGQKCSNHSNSYHLQTKTMIKTQNNAHVFFVKYYILVYNTFPFLKD